MLRLFDFVAQDRAAAHLMEGRDLISHRSHGGQTVAVRLTIAESDGNKRAYSYLVSEEAKLKLGTFTDDSSPEELEWELERFGQSDDAPGFIWEPAGELNYHITLEED